MNQAQPCICGKHMMERANEGTCVWCGHGAAVAVLEHAYRRNMVGPPFPPVTVPSPVVQLHPRRSWDEDECVRAAREWEREHGELPTSTAWMLTKLPGEYRPSYLTVRRLFGGWPGFMAAIADVPREDLLAA